MYAQGWLVHADACLSVTAILIVEKSLAFTNSNAIVYLENPLGVYFSISFPLSCLYSPFK